jgi:hypothetical protein
MTNVSPEPRRLSLWLILGVQICPVIFTWFLLRRGYSHHVRLGGFLLMGHSLLTALAAAASTPF